KNASALVQTAPVREGTLQQFITAYGVVQPDPDRAHTVSMPHEGIIGGVFVRPGQTVKAGDPLVEIENSPNATAQYDQSVAAVTFARHDLAREKRLLKEHLATRDQVAAAEKALTDAEAGYAQMQKTGVNQENKTLRSPFDGIVTAVMVTAGAHLQASAVLLTIGDKNALVVALGLEPEDAPRIRAGAAVRLSAPLDPAVSIDAKIGDVLGMTDPATHLVDALVQIGAPATDGLVLGMTLKGKIALQSYTGAIVPHAALMQDARGAYLFTLRNGTARKTYVSVAFDDDKDAVLKDGIAADTPVVVSGNAALNDGDAVRTLKDAEQ
ncbi:MAG: efflux RND transporter periplasmic adaptor subunit, partial [Alphaproteobacteria bacterium]|nr:efflux RND transporter periplasmic adaptor subunit [Alphaproteobacteria bacterium]